MTAFAPIEWDDVTIAQIIARVQDPKRERFFDDMRRCGNCQRPIRLKASTSRPGRPSVLLVRCRNRRESVCPSCSWEYQGDVWQLLFAGIAGGRKGIPETVALHPMVFATLTAPGFGAVHTTRDDGRSCRLTRDRRLCAHGQPTWCDLEHANDDPALGDPLCPECYRYEDAVLFNWYAPELWRRFTIQARRDLAKAAGSTRMSYAKVAEFQRRGVVHLHAIIRADATTDDLLPPLEISASTLANAVGRAARAVQASAGNASIRFGRQLDVSVVGWSGETVVEPQAIAAYLAKYATKAADDLGLDGRVRDPSQLDRAELRPHIRRMVEMAWQLGETDPGLRRWAHALGFRGHFSTKSRRYSTTLTALRQARIDFHRQDNDATPESDEWQFDGTGYLTAGDAALARTAALHERERRQLRRLERTAGHA